MEDRKILIAPSILSADFSRLQEEIKAIEKAGADWVHIDVMDGNFVPNITIGPDVIFSMRKVSNLFFDVHLMIEDPLKYIDRFISAGSDMITFHVESCKGCLEIIEKIKNKGKKAGISVKPGTDISGVYDILEYIDMALVMTVEPGFAGQSFMEEMLDKVRVLKDRFKGYIEVDGGVTPISAPMAIKAGANVLVAGTAVFGKKDYRKAIRELRWGIKSASNVG